MENSGASLLGVCWGGKSSSPGLSKHIKIILGGGRLTAGQGAKGAAHTVCAHVCRDRNTSHGSADLMETWYDFKSKAYYNTYTYIMHNDRQLQYSNQKTCMRFTNLDQPAGKPRWQGTRANWLGLHSPCCLKQQGSLGQDL